VLFPLLVLLFFFLHSVLLNLTTHRPPTCHPPTTHPPTSTTRSYEPFFDTLRTKEQLGYTVSSGARLTHGALGLCCLVQSGARGPAHLDARIDAFLAAFAARLAAMPAEEFDKNRAALVAAKLSRDPNMLAESDRDWDALTARGRDFAARRDEAAALRRLTLAETAAFFAETLAPGGASRRKLAVHVASAAHAGELAAPPPPGAELLAPEGLEAAKARWGFYAPIADKA
jgi:nardilysin